MKARDGIYEPANSEFLAEMSAYADVDVARAYARARRLRSEQFHRLVVTPLARALRRALDAIGRYRREQATIRALSELSDHTLRDIGIHRSEIPRIAAGCAARRAPEAKRAAIRATAVCAPREAANDGGPHSEAERLAG